MSTTFPPGYLSYPTVIANTGPRDKKKMLELRFCPHVERFLSNRAVQDAKVARKQLHTENANVVIRFPPLNPVLNRQPPDIAEEESSLPPPVSHHPLSTPLRTHDPYLRHRHLPLMQPTQTYHATHLRMSLTPHPPRCKKPLGEPSRCGRQPGNATWHPHRMNGSLRR